MIRVNVRRVEVRLQKHLAINIRENKRWQATRYTQKNTIKIGRIIVSRKDVVFDKGKFDQMKGGIK